MTWYYDIAADGSSMDVYDHAGTLIETLTNDGSGFTIPDDILEVMRSDHDAEGLSGLGSGRQAKILSHVITQDVEEGIPP